MTTKEDKN